MRPSTPAPTVRLCDYIEPEFWIKTVDLQFKLHPTATRVRSKIEFSANEARKNGPHDLRLHGQELKLICASINGRVLESDEIHIDAEGLTIRADLVPQSGFVWQAEVEINPKANTTLTGLYVSNNMYCTQCEAEGFRKITYYLDRPDVMAIFTVAIESNGPVILSNGNRLGDGKGSAYDNRPDDSNKSGDGKKPCTARWHDPWPKPAYLFALVSGDLVSHNDSFTTMSGRKIALEIWVHPGDEHKCAYAMDSLKRAMKWDEDVYGREMDLDLYMIVAVHDFNMGAMENKGLNIFNSKFVLASAQSATDHDYKLIESIIAHEYFHNWTGNRITCRDWFQLCLKEGLTVFRDQQFSGDMRSKAVNRIENVLSLRAVQFREDAGPLAHPVRPEEYIEINNFYTATVYQKGAEVIAMLHTLVGGANYRAALDLYFERHDGQACTVEQWIRVFEDTCDTDLTQFALWYSQAGTPRIGVSESFEGTTLTLTFTQDIAQTTDRKNKQPQVIPLRTGFLGADGAEAAPEQVFELTGAKQSFQVQNLAQKPTVSYLRGFSAPVVMNVETDNLRRAFLLTHDTDPFNRWEAGREFAKDLLQNMALGRSAPLDEFTRAIAAVATDTSLDPAFRALVLGLPGEDTLAQAMFDAGHTPDPDAIYDAIQTLTQAIAMELASELPGLYTGLAIRGPYTPDAGAAGKRALRAAVLSLLCYVESDCESGSETACETAKTQFAQADNMTEQFSALSNLIAHGQGNAAIDAFYTQWHSDRLVIGKWFMVQAVWTPPHKALTVARDLTQHPDFDWKNPNCLRSVIAGFGMMNPAGFHHKNGQGYEFFADWLIKLDPLNPQVTARLCGGFQTWQHYDAERQGLMRTQLERIAALRGLSKDTSEIVDKILG